MKILSLRARPSSFVLDSGHCPSTSPRTNAGGNVLMLAVVTAAIVSALLIGCLSLVHSQNVAMERSQAWNECIPVLEAGIEEAMAHLNNRADTNITSDGWVLQNGLYIQQRSIGSGFYFVGINITNVLKPVIVCTGYVALSAVAGTAQTPAFSAAMAVPPPGSSTQYVVRAVQVIAEKRPLYVKAMVSRDKIKMNGNDIITDSFDSSDPNYSTPTGQYDPTKIKDNGDVSTTGGLVDIGNADIKGRVRTGPGGAVGLGPNGVVGSLGWHATHTGGAEPGWITHDMNVSFPDVDKPFSGAGIVPKPATVNGVAAKYAITNTGNYQLGALTLSSSDHLIVTTNAILYVTGTIDISGNGVIDVIAPATFQIYMGGKSASIAGIGVNNTGRAPNFSYFGLPSHTDLTMQASGEFTGGLYAPSANLRMAGGGGSIQNFVGACVMYTITIGGHYSFHYDEALGKFGPPADYVIISWIEI